METSAREAWRRWLEGWAIPQHLIDGVGVDKGRWEPEFAERIRRFEPAAVPQSGTFAVVHELSAGGSVLDVGSGATSPAIALAERGHRVTVVEGDAGVASSQAAEAVRAGTKLTHVIGAWPFVAGNTGVHDVVMSAETIYGVVGIGDFVAAMHRCARRGVVIELTPRHPWAPLSRYFRALHGLDRPTRPNVDDFIRVVEEVTGAITKQSRWSVATGLRFADIQELLTFYRRRLLVPPPRSMEAAALLEPDIRRTQDGWLVLGAEEREMVTVWWKK